VIVDSGLEFDGNESSVVWVWSISVILNEDFVDLVDLRDLFD